MKPMFSAIWGWLKEGWNIMRTVYWYNSIPWRILKSGALFFLGFFCLAGANLVHSFKPHWTFLNYLKSYGFLLIIYGPIHHLVVIPISLRLTHYSWGQALNIGKRVPFWTFNLFIVAVLIFGYSPLNIMEFSFNASSLGQTADVDPEVTCYRKSSPPNPQVECQIPSMKEIDLVEVENNGKTVLTDRSVPYEFTIDLSKLEDVVGVTNFHIILRDEDGYMLRRYVRDVAQFDTVDSSDTGRNTSSKP